LGVKRPFFGKNRSNWGEGELICCLRLPLIFYKIKGFGKKWTGAQKNTESEEVPSLSVFL
jgi:hypothetical protein